MKKVLIILALACSISHAAMSQQATYKVEGNTYKAVTKTTPKRVSSRTGRYYRQYLGEAISRDICVKVGKDYKGKTKISK